MSTKPKSKVVSAVAEYQVVNGRVQPNKAASAVVKKFNLAKKSQAAVDATYVGACMLSIFIKHPWLKSMELCLSAESEYDDQGGTFRSISGSVRSVTAVEGCPAPDDITNEKGVVEETSAEDLLDQHIDDNDLAGEIYNAIFESWDYGECTIELDRRKVSDLLETSTMSGLKAFKALMPEHTYRLVD